MGCGDGENAGRGESCSWRSVGCSVIEIRRDDDAQMASNGWRGRQSRKGKNRKGCREKQIVTRRIRPISIVCVKRGGDVLQTDLDRVLHARLDDVD